MTKKKKRPPVYDRPRNPYTAIADNCNLSERTIRDAFARKPVTRQTACIISKHTNIDIIHFRIKMDNRGRNKKQKRCDVVPAARSS